MDTALIIIGDEILKGVVAETNLQYLARKCLCLGLKIRRVFTIGDNASDIIWALNQARYVAKIIFVSGGLGPTPDDVTRKVISKHFNTPLVEDEEVLNRIIDHFIKREKPLPAWIENQSFIPKGSIKLMNPIGTAPGLLIKRRSSHYFFFPGVPAELRAIFEAEVVKILTDLLPAKKETSILIRTTGISESKIWELVEPDLPSKELSLSFLPGWAGVDLLVRSEERSLSEKTLGQIKSKIQPYIYATDEIELNEVIGQMLKKERKTISIAESCTGGLLGRLLTDVPGSSEYFIGGIIAYSNQVKIKELGVKREILERYGAVSAETCQVMAEGIRSRLDTDIGIGITGIAGPGGGTKDKPVGLVYIGLVTKKEKLWEKYIFGGDRRGIREKAAVAALDLIRRYLTGIIK